MADAVNATPEKGIIFAIANSRVIVSRIFAVGVLMLILFTGHSFSQSGVVDTLFEVSGLFLLSICSLGRLWALMYISGNKRRKLVIEGPYSVVRHPLYVFSLIGAFGIGLASENLLVLAVIIVFYLFYYPFTILAEEKKLTNQFGKAYRDYMENTPRFLPKWSLYKEAQVYEVKAVAFVKNFADGMWFIWVFMLMHVIEMLQESGHIPIILRVP